MATEEDLEKAKDETADEAEESEGEGSAEKADALEVRSKSDAPNAKDDLSTETAPATTEGGETEAAPMQLGYVRYVYAAYMAGAMLAAFLVAKTGHIAWYKLGQWKPEFGEPKDEMVYPVAGVIGVLIALYYWRKASSRQYASEVAEELSKVTWPSRKEVTNSTFVVVMTTVFATVFFALMDQFWKYVTDKIYSF